MNNTTNATNATNSLIRSIVRAAVGLDITNNSAKVTMHPGGDAPFLTGSCGGWFTLGGRRIHHPSAYSKKGWSNMEYCRDDRMVDFGEKWLKKHTPKGMTWGSTKKGVFLQRGGMRYFPCFKDFARKDFCQNIRRQMAEIWKNGRRVARGSDTGLVYETNATHFQFVKKVGVFTQTT